VDDQEATSERELLFYPDHGIVAPKKHRGVFDRPPGVVWIDKFTQD
jgi:hypothetical protein